MKDILSKLDENYLPYKEYRKSQEKGIPEVYECVENNGYVTLEGACGTGKTLLSLLPLIDLIKDDTKKFKKILVLTSVRQQKEVFEEEINKINSVSDKDIKAISISGKSELCTYVDEDTIKPWSIQSKCTHLRDNTFDLGNYKNLYNKEKKNDISNMTPEYPFDATEIPEEENKQYCPFYAKYLDELDEGEIDTGFLDYDKTVNEKEYVKESSKKGLCPHAIMSNTIEESDIIIANYNHVFDEKTVESLTEEYINEETLVVFDEAHNMVERLRRVLSDNITYNDIVKSLDDLNIIYHALEFSEKEITNLKKLMNGKKVNDNFDEEKVKKKFENFKDNVYIKDYSGYSYLQLIEEIISYISSSPSSKREDCIKSYNFLESLRKSVKRKLTNEKYIKTSNDKDIVPLRDVKNIRDDNIKQWFDLSSYNDIEKILSNLIIMTYCRKKLDKNYKKSGSKEKYVSEEVSLFFRKWFKSDNKTYFKYMQLFRKKEENKNIVEDFNVTINMFNCLPRDKIAKKLDKFGGGILMSATLSPINVFIEEIGLDKLDRETKKLEYPLNFPKENRLTIGGKLTKFKYKNKGPTRKNNKINLNEVREEYLEVLYDLVKESKGNTMIVMPSYPEASWLDEVFRLHTDLNPDRIVLDESVSKKENKDIIKKQFFNKKEGILITTANGVLVEGIDYKGDKLKNVIVCGVPIKNVTNIIQKSIKTSYEKEFGEKKAFDYSFTIPAVRKVRQSIGRVIRKDDDKGTRYLLDKRYCTNKDRDSVNKYLSEQEREEILIEEKQDLSNYMKDFWS